MNLPPTCMLWAPLQKDLNRLERWAEEASEIQQRLMQGPAPGEEQPVQAGGRPAVLRWPCLNCEVGPGDSLWPLWTLPILWFCEPYKICQSGAPSLSVATPHPGSSSCGFSGLYLSPLHKCFRTRDLLVFLQALEVHPSRMPLLCFLQCISCSSFRPISPKVMPRMGMF